MNRGLLALLTALLTCCCSSFANAQLVGYWTFDDTTADASGMGNDGTIVGGVSYDADVPAAIGSGTSASFDGVAGTYVNVTQNQMLPITTQDAFSIAMWVKGDGTVDNNDDRIFSEAMTTDSSPLFNLGTKNDGANGQHDFFFRNGASPGHQFSTAEPFDNTWRHIAWVDTGHVGVLYVDGVEDSTYDYASFVNDGFAPDTTTIGGILRDGDCCNYTGLIDDAAVWKGALSAASVEALAGGTSPADIVIPEPSSLLLGLMSLLALVGIRRRIK